MSGTAASSQEGETPAEATTAATAATQIKAMIPTRVTPRTLPGTRTPCARDLPRDLKVAGPPAKGTVGAPLVRWRHRSDSRVAGEYNQPHVEA